MSATTTRRELRKLAFALSPIEQARVAADLRYVLNHSQGQAALSAHAMTKCEDTLAIAVRAPRALWKLAKPGPGAIVFDCEIPAGAGDMRMSCLRYCPSTFPSIAVQLHVKFNRQEICWLYHHICRVGAIRPTPVGKELKRHARIDLAPEIIQRPIESFATIEDIDGYLRRFRLPPTLRAAMLAPAR